jgi:hypothetical protein
VTFLVAGAALARALVLDDDTAFNALFERLLSTIRFG